MAGAQGRSDRAGSPSMSLSMMSGRLAGSALAAQRGARGRAVKRPAPQRSFSGVSASRSGRTGHVGGNDAEVDQQRSRLLDPMLAMARNKPRYLCVLTSFLRINPGTPMRTYRSKTMANLSQAQSNAPSSVCPVSVVTFEH